MNKRINFIDIARAFAIIFIALGHTLVHSVHCTLIFKFFYSFHVVLFFILSGYTFKIKDKESFFPFFKSKFIRILLPYFIWAFLFLIPYIILGQDVGGAIGTKSSFEIKTQFINVLYGNGYLSALKQNSSLWFLPALFTMEIFYYFIIQFIEKKKRFRFPLLLSLIAIGYLTNYFLPIIFPWGINTTLELGFFFLIGYLLKELGLCKKEKWFKFYFILPVAIMGVLSCFLNTDVVSCIDYAYGNYTLALLSGLCLSIVITYISYIINKNKILEYIGRNTMGILIFHKIIILIFQTKLGFISNLLKNSNMLTELLLSLFITSLSILFSLLATEVIRKIAPFLIGERKNQIKKI